MILFVTILIEFPGNSELKHEVRRLETQIHYTMSQLTRQVKRRDRFRHRRERQYNLITAILQASSQKRSESLVDLYSSGRSIFPFFGTVN